MSPNKLRKNKNKKYICSNVHMFVVPEDGKTSVEKLAFIQAARDGNVETLTKILESGSYDIDDVDCFGQTALMWATGK